MTTPLQPLVTPLVTLLLPHCNHWLHHCYPLQHRSIQFLQLLTIATILFSNLTMNNKVLSFTYQYSQNVYPGTPSETIGSLKVWKLYPSVAETLDRNEMLTLDNLESMDPNTVVLCDYSYSNETLSSEFCLPGVYTRAYTVDEVLTQLLPKTIHLIEPSQ